MRRWVWLLVLCTVFAVARCLPTSPAEVAKNGEQATRPKPKRAQETLMFGNQQSRQTESSDPSASYSSPPNADKRSSNVAAATASGLGGLKTALAEEGKSSRPGHVTNQRLYDTDPFPPYNDVAFDYGKTSTNELTDEAPSLPRTWEAPPYSRYYDLDENRRKRSEKSGGSRGSTTAKPPIGSPWYPTYPTATLFQSAQHQAKRSVPIYQEPRFKRELDIDPEDVLTLLSLWENERRKRNWQKNVNEEYDNADDEDNLIEEDPRNVISWVDSSMYPPRRYSVQTPFSPSDIGIIRTHPSGYYYDRYGGDDDDNDDDEEENENDGHRYGQRYDGSRYADAPYGLVYPQQTYYETPAKRLTLSRKRSQIYDPYAGATQFQTNPRSRGHLYQHRLVY